jgi:DNA invertase Pin-like site-specific DNA recombinase
MSNKIRAEHLARKAYCYLRQSTNRQVMHNTGSTEMQYALKDKAMEFGWPENRIRVLDQDLGLSGTEINNRHSLQELTSEMARGEVGAIFVAEISRLDRSNAYFHHFLKICQHTNALILDRDGIYDPNNPADQLMLGIKSAVAQAELKVQQARMQGAKLHKADKGVLKFRLSCGYCYDGLGNLIIEADEEIRSAIKMLFDIYKGVSSAADVAKYFHKHGLNFPVRLTRGTSSGKIVWKPLTPRRVMEVLKNPTYAGIYTYGRQKVVSKINEDGTICSAKKTIPMSEWKVFIKEHHEGYITSEDYMQNQKKLADNCNREYASSTVREGSTILQGILICKVCGRFMNTRYIGDNGKTPQYYCFKPQDGKSCTSICAHPIDKALSTRILSLLQQDQIEIALAAVEDWEKKKQEVNRQWCLKIERAEYESSLAEIRFKKVDPNNRLVANNLEREWNKALIAVESIKEEYDKFKQNITPEITREEKEKFIALSQNTSELWQAPTTTNKERKQLIRILIKDIVIKKETDEVLAFVRWQGGRTETINVPISPKARTLYSKELLKRSKS